MKKIPVFTSSFKGNELKYLTDCIETGWISSEGPYVHRLEKEFAAMHGKKHGISVCNGTAALELALVALDLKEGDEVILPSFTIISCISAIIRVGAVPVLVDCDPLTWNMDVTQVESRITPRTRAVMAVHIYGLPVDMDPLLEIVRAHNLILIEDAAEAIGLAYRDRLCGSFGHINTFSFYANKHITTGEGGMVVTDDDALAERCRSYKNLCFQPARRFVHEEMGWNLRMCNLQAAVGVAQLERLPQTLQRKREIGWAYTERLAGFSKIQLPLKETTKSQNVYWVYGIVLTDETNLDANAVRELLAQQGVDTRPFFWPMHEQPVLHKQGLFLDERLPHAERLARRGFYLPAGMDLTTEQMDHVVHALKTILS